MNTVFNSVGPYEIVGEIGRGGMATVFLANDTRTNRQVALKLVPTGSDREAREIVEAERRGAELQARFGATSRYVPEVYEHDTSGGYFYIAMEYLEGQNLSDLIARGPIAPERAIDLTLQLCQFLEAAHSFETSIDGQALRSIVHGDLKPRNIRVLQDDRIKVLDFGIAKALSLSRKVTRNDFGTFGYLSPEWFDSDGTIDSHVDLWAIGVLLYEMISGIQPFAAPDTRRLEQQIRSRRPPASLAGRCPVGLEGIVAKLLAASLADRYESATTLRLDLESFKAGAQTEAERQGWPKMANDEPPTRRTRPDEQPVDEVTRRTLQSGAAQSPSAASAVPADGMPTAAPAPRKRRGRFRLMRTALVLFALATLFNQYRLGAEAARLAANVPTRELDGLADAWSTYHDLRARSFRIGVVGLERALVRQSTTLADRVIANYRQPVPTVREAQWRMARAALAQAAAVEPNDSTIRASLRYCDGHLHRINGEARKARRHSVEAQIELTDAVIAFREAAELRPDWPDPFLGLMRTFIYGLEDVDHGADALQQAQRLGYTPGDREMVQLADGYRARGDTLARTARTLAGMSEEQDYLSRAAEAYRQALDRYGKVLAYGDVPRSLRQTQRAVRQIEQRIAEMSAPPAPASLPAAEQAGEPPRWL